MSTAILRKFNLKILAVGHVVFHSIDYGFDYVLYPFMIYKYGPFYGYLIMAFLSAAACLAVSYFYDLLKKDWLGIETVKELVERFFEEEKEIAKKSWKKWGKKILSWIFHKNKLGQFIFLTVQFDPLITTVYMRRGHHLYNGFNARDWKIFWASVLFSNLFWLIFMFPVAEIIRKIIN